MLAAALVLMLSLTARADVTAQPGGPLPARLPTPLAHDTCTGCPRPTHAVLLRGVFFDPRQVEPVVRRDWGEGVPAGYPFAADARSLGVAHGPSGYVVVMGLFLGEQEADRWRERQGLSKLAYVADLQPPSAAASAEGSRVAVQIQRDGGAAVLAREVVGKSRAQGKPPDAQAPLCRLEDGTILSARVDALLWYGWVPARCPGGSRGYVAWGDTLIAATVYPDGRVVQLVGVEGGAVLAERRR